ncbi:MAG: methylaspartate mutase subunit S [Peptococcaceae bacterium]|nr:methylaspartate mutase subunit S [Peptococcaceae bacterium]
MDKKTIVLGTIGSDAHMIGIWVIRKALEAAGFKVIFLGAVVPQEEFINAAIESNAGAILVSSLYGMGPIDCEGMRQKCIESGLSDVLLYVGGCLVAPAEVAKKWQVVHDQFIQMGFSRVFPNDTLPEDIIKALNQDLRIAE